MGLGKALIDLQCLQRRGFRFRYRLLRRKPTKDREELGIGIRQPGISQGVRWVFVESLLEVRYGFLRALFCRLVPIVAALQIGLIRLGVLGVTLAQPLLFLASQL